MRYEEAASLRWIDVDFDKQVLHIREHGGFKPKTKNANRTIPISDRLLTELVDLKKNPYSTELVFATKSGGTITQHAAIYRCKKAAKQAGIERVAKLHKFRSSFASHLVQKGVKIQDVSKLLGHSSISETEIYAYLAPDDMHIQVNVICSVDIKITTK